MAGKGHDRNPVAVSDLATANPRSGAAQARGHLDRAGAVVGGDRRPAACRAARGPKRSSGRGACSDDDPFEPAVLVVACEGAAALHLQHETGEIIGRVNAFLGFSAVGRIRIVQKPVASGTPPSRNRSRARCRQDEKARLAGTVGKIEDDGLRASLERLGATIVGMRKPKA